VDDWWWALARVPLQHPGPDPLAREGPAPRRPLQREPDRPGPLRRPRDERDSVLRLRPRVRHPPLPCSVHT